MALVRVLWPETAPELITVVALLQAHDIPCFVHNAGFGGLYPGVQVNTYNTRSIMVPEEIAPDALQLIRDFQKQPPTLDPAVEARALSKLRALLELLLFGWFVPGSRRSAIAERAR